MEWNLRDRLQQAEQARRLAAGLPVNALPEPEPAPAEPAGDEVLRGLDLTDPSHVLSYVPEPTRRVAMFADAAQASAAFGAGADDREVSGTTMTSFAGAAGIGLPVWQGTAPASAPSPTDAPVPSRAPVKDPCPACRGKVRLVRFDLDRAMAHMSCTECGHRYTARSPKG